MSIVMPTGAKRISSDWTVFYKHIFTPLWFCLIAMVLVILLVGGRQPHAVPVGVFIVPVFLAVLGYFLFKTVLSGLMEEVWDNGHELIVVNDGHVEHVPLANVINVSYSGFTNPKRVTLSLRDAGRYGEHIAFIPAISMFWPVNLMTSPLVEDLIKRADAARQKT